MIDEILSIKLIELKMVERTNQLQDVKDTTEYLIGVKFKIDKVSYNENEEVYSVRTTFNLEVFPKENDADEDDSKESHLTSAEFVNGITFKSKDSEINNNNEFGQEISRVLEPYYRELINSVYYRTEIDVPFLPYKFLKIKDAD